jgi:hypothetical protein
MLGLKPSYLVLGGVGAGAGAGGGLGSVCVVMGYSPPFFSICFNPVDNGDIYFAFHHR